MIGTRVVGRQSRATPGMREVVGCVCLVIGVAALGASGRGDFADRLRMAVVGAVFVGSGCFAAVRLVDRKRRTPVLVQLGPATIVLYTLSFAIFALAWLSPQSGAASVIDPGSVPRAVVTASVGLVAATAGYLVGLPGAVVGLARSAIGRVFPPGPWGLRVPSIAIVLYLAGFGARLARISSGQYGYLQDAAQSLASPSPIGQVLSLVESLTMTGLVVAAIDSFALSRSPRSRLVLGGMVLVEVCVGLSAASKEGVLFTLVAVGIVRACSGRPVRTAHVLLSAVFVSMLFPFVADYRTSLRGGSAARIAPSTALSQIPSAIGRTMEGITPRSVLIDGPSAVARRLRLVDNLALVQQKTPDQLAYRPWSGLLTDPLVASVPRALWPSKPIVSTGREFAQRYYELPSFVFSANGVTLPGDLFRHGGLVPLVVGMAVLGVVLRLFDSTFTPRDDLRHLVFVVPAYLHIIKIEGDVTAFVVGLIQLLIFLALVSWVVFVPTSARSAKRADSALNRRRPGVALASKSTLGQPH